MGAKCSLIPSLTVDRHSYMYAGYDSDGGVIEDIWILSLPAFRWFKATTKNAFSRFGHSCVVVGSQMVVVGGFREPLWQKSDHFENGIGVLDLNSLTWKDSFTADSASYEGPTAVRAWYRDRYVALCRFPHLRNSTDHASAVMTHVIGKTTKSRSSS